jgi:AraC-like DNA-binding protein
MSIDYLPAAEAALAIKNGIDANPLAKLSPSELASRYNTHRNKLLPAFKELTGKTIRSYQFEKLMQAASEMLLAGLTIKEVAIKCGFEDHPNNFSRSFKNVFNMGPVDWQRANWSKQVIKHPAKKKIVHKG